MIASKEDVQPNSSDPLPNSKRVYVSGKHHPDLRVSFREISLASTKAFNGDLTPNEPVRVYDTSGPGGIPNSTATSSRDSRRCGALGSCPERTLKNTQGERSNPRMTATSPVSTLN